MNTKQRKERVGRMTRNSFGWDIYDLVDPRVTTILIPLVTSFSELAEDLLFASRRRRSMSSIKFIFNGWSSNN